MSFFNKCSLCNKELEGILGWSTTWFVKSYDFPVSPGHVLLVPSHHITSIDDFTEEENQALPGALAWAKYLVEAADWSRRYTDAQEYVSEKALPFLENALKSPFLKEKPVEYAVGIDEDKVLFQNGEHVLIHVIPRYENDTRNFIPELKNIFSE